MYYNDKETRIINDVFSSINQQLMEQKPEEGVNRPYVVSLRFRLTDEDKKIVESIMFNS